MPLTDFSPDVESVFIGVEPGSSLYVASNDDNSLLKGITVTSGVTTFTLDEINYVNGDGTASFFTLHDNLTISTSNDYTVTQSLTGFIYVTSMKQAVDPNFIVFVVKSNHTINIPSNVTAVVLNTALKSSNIMDSLKTTYISKINQSPDSDLHFHYGYPPNDWQTQIKNRFFNNPVYLSYYDDNGQVYNTTRIFFPTVEPLQINLDYWYFTTSAPVTMELENKYKEELVHNTTSVNSTGVIVNNYIYQEHLVNFDMDYTRGKTVGMLISATLDSDLNVYFMSEDGGMMEASYHNGTNLQGSTFWSPLPANKLIVNSSSLMPGSFYCQYFAMAGDLLPGSSTVGSTLDTVPTTVTGSSNSPTAGTGPTDGTVPTQATVPTDGTVPSTVTVATANPTVSSTATELTTGVTSAATVPSDATVLTTMATVPTEPSTTNPVVTTVLNVNTVATPEASVPSTVLTVGTVPTTVPTDPPTTTFVVTTVPTLRTVVTTEATVPSTVPTDATVATVGTVVTTVPTDPSTTNSVITTVPSIGTVVSSESTVTSTVPIVTTVPTTATVPTPSPSPSAPSTLTSSVPLTTPNLVPTSTVPPTVPPTSTTVPTTTQSAPGYSLASLASILVKNFRKKGKATTENNK
ncbi:hypothetical protein CAEBREN_17998 [Caenorhabditis brenneri]|uniref:Uncharacterized protein n=1 Tax=Caenorhabditis brenneri TaxID=135651 RepID=G0P308_CAEBE|nr:hypothetical protein CAEBREN_17998 [Caenorhabditis brenneri]